MSTFIGFIKDYWGVIVGVAGFFFKRGRFKTGTPRFGG